MTSQRKRQTATLRRTCVVHRHSCLWAGGDGSLEREAAWFQATMWGFKHPDASDEDLLTEAELHLSGVDPYCRQATPHDRKYGLGIYAERTPFLDPEMEQLAAQARAALSPEKLAAKKRQGERMDRLEAQWMKTPRPKETR
jgi:hypothetical protein